MTSSLDPTPASTPSTANEWVWVSGSDTENRIGQPGTAIYGTIHVASPNNMPGQRSGAMSWTDASGNLWLFGGFGADAVSGSTEMNDLWEFRGGEWTWQGGSDRPNGKGIYGTRGVPSADNIPGARDGAATWTDASGNLWLFGGEWVVRDPFNNVIGYAPYQDLWKFDGKEWTWVGGPDKPQNGPGIYGKQGTPSPENIPGARSGAVTWQDKENDQWLFGGVGCDSVGNSGPLNDLWRYSHGEWTWMSGSKIAAQSGSYGTRGVASSKNHPGARGGSVGWADASGNLWLFAGITPEGWRNDLWKWSGSEWTWIGGSDELDQPGIYGSKGKAAADNIPAARSQAVAWIDASGNAWLFGGVGPGASNLNDLWKFSGGEWTWMSGSSQGDQHGVYGTKGKAAAANTPGGRSGSVGWTDKQGNIWLYAGGTGYFTWYNDLWEYKP
jgi:hypothetical protein